MALLKTFTEAAEEVGCTKRALRLAVVKGDLNIVRMGKSSRSDLIHTEDLIKFIERLRQRGQTLCQEQYDQLRLEEINSISVFRTKEKKLDQLLATKSGKRI